jgi:hypothetical protein
MIRRTLIRTVLFGALVLGPFASVGISQEGRIGNPSYPATNLPVTSIILDPADASPLRFADPEPERRSRGFLTGNRDFPNFIGFLSNPIQSVDPRAVTEMWPMFGSAWASSSSPILPMANAQVYGAGLNVALSERLCVGLNQGGYAVVRINADRERLLARLGLPIPDRDRSGFRSGWLNLGGFVQYTLIANVPRQCILTAGLRWEAPSGNTQVFQGGDNPAYLAPYVTAGKEFGCWHVLATAGYEFPAGSGTATTDTFYLNVHLDRKIGRIYPLFELNGSCHTRTVDLNLPARHGVIDLGTFSSTGNILSEAVGANVVLVPGKLEFGAVYTRPIASQGHFDFNGLLVKMVYRF